jgi:hypothetical protein
VSAVNVPESFLIRVWSEPTDEAAAEAPVLRGSIQHVPSGHKTYFTSLDLPLALLRATADRLAGRQVPLD